jgi:23S rRNA (guanine745-N1)-methyltransferase
MLRQRRSFLDAGHYQPLRDALAAHAAPGQAVLDAGCGEGYYTRDWPATHERLELWAVDIAKPAVRMAAKRRRDGAHYGVASVYDLPVVDGSVDLVLSVFAPLPAAEFERVLRPGGRLVTVTPGPGHLAGLKARLFESPEAHPDAGPFDGEDKATRFTAADHQRIRYDLHLRDPAAIADLVGMTPYGWYVGSDVRDAVAASGSLSTPVEFILSSYYLP